MCETVDCVCSHLEQGEMGDDPTLERSFRGHQDAVRSVVFNPNMKQLLSGADDGDLMFWNFKPTLRSIRCSDHTGPVLSVAIAQEKGIIASGSKDRTIRLWAPHISSKGKSTVIKAHTGGVRCVAFSPDSTSLLSASDDKTIKLWSLAGQKFKLTLSGHSNWVKAARFAPAGDLVVSAGDDKTVRLWDLHNRQLIHTYYDHTGPVNDCCFHPDGLCVAACSADNTIKIWDTRMNQLLQHYSAHLNSVNSIAIHPSGDYMLSGSSDMTTKIWDLREGHLCYTLHGHKGAVNSVAFSPEGDYFASGSSDTYLLVWKTNFDTSPAEHGNPVPAPAEPSNIVSHKTKADPQASHAPRLKQPVFAEPPEEAEEEGEEEEEEATHANVHFQSAKLGAQKPDATADYDPVGSQYEDASDSANGAEGGFAASLSATLELLLRSQQDLVRQQQELMINMRDLHIQVADVSARVALNEKKIEAFGPPPRSAASVPASRPKSAGPSR